MFKLFKQYKYLMVCSLYGIILTYWKRGVTFWPTLCSHSISVQRKSCTIYTQLHRNIPPTGRLHLFI